MTRGLIRTSLLAAMTLLLGVGSAWAEMWVTACDSDTQSGAGLNLAQALVAGGVIRFQCPTGSTIRVTGHYTLTRSTLIDGGDAVTLDGHGAFGLLLTAAENIVLRHITLRGFTSVPVIRPVGRPEFTTVLHAGGNAELDHVTVEGSNYPIKVNGIATVRDSAFVGNRGFALQVGGTAFVERTRFTGNQQALEIKAGWVRNCDFTGQTGRAVTVRSPSGPVEIRHSTFTATRGAPALALSQRAGPSGPQTVTVRANVFRDNDGGVKGGAIDLYDMVQEARDHGAPSAAEVFATWPPAGFVLSYNRFIGNRSGHGGAISADLVHTNGMVSTGDLFMDNAAVGAGGAVAVSGGALRMSHTLFKGNRAGAEGAALAVLPNATATLANALVVGNAGPSGTIEGSAVTLANVTVADNYAVGLLLETSSARATNVLLSRNRPADCARVPAGAFQGGALQSDGSCPGVATGEAFLDAFYVPAVGSPALRAGDPRVCHSAQVGGFDLPFQGRVNPSVCALGAFERAPVRKFSVRAHRHEAHADKQDDFSDDKGYQPSPVPTGSGGGPSAPVSPAAPTVPPDPTRSPSRTGDRP